MNALWRVCRAGRGCCWSSSSPSWCASIWRSSPYYLGVDNIVNLFQLSIEKIIVALTMTLIIISGEIDLSVASIMGLAACVMAWLFQHGRAASAGASWPPSPSGALAGLINGFWVAYVGLPSLAVTLAGLIGYRGVARILVEDRSIGGYPGWFNALGQQPLFGPLTLSIIIFLVLFVISADRPATALASAVSSMSSATTWRRRAIRACARKRVKLCAVRRLRGQLPPWPGCSMRRGSASVRGDMAEGFELDIITIVLLGGVSIFGGSGNLVGVGLSILVILNLRNGMGLANITGNTQTSVIGALLILSVLVPNMAQMIHNKWKGREDMKKMLSDDRRPGDARGSAVRAPSPRTARPRRARRWTWCCCRSSSASCRFDQAHNGALEAQKELQNPTELQFLGPTPDNSVAGQIEIVTNATTQGVDAIMISNNFGDQIVPAAKAAHDKGIKVVTWDSPIPSAEGEDVFVAQVDFTETGKVMADMALKILARRRQVRHPVGLARRRQPERLDHGLAGRR